jgi:GntR family transcriptional repressor for pyruvate dehydrogenase complex
VKSIADESAGSSSEKERVPALFGVAVAGIMRLSAADTVRARIGLAIELGLITSGEQLPSDAVIAAALNVSEITARRALKSLADEGVLSRKRGRHGGTFVNEQATTVFIEAVATYRADTAEVHELINERVLLECALTHHAALNVTDEQLVELRSYVAQAAASKNWADYHIADEKLHMGIARASGLTWALPQYSRISNALHQYFLPYPILYLHEVNLEHADLIEALQRRDCIASVAIMKHHGLTLHESMFVGLAERNQVTQPAQGKMRLT